MGFLAVLDVFSFSVASTDIINHIFSRGYLNANSYRKIGRLKASFKHHGS